MAARAQKKPAKGPRKHSRLDLHIQARKLKKLPEVRCTFCGGLLYTPSSRQAKAGPTCLKKRMLRTDYSAQLLQKAFNHNLFTSVLMVPFRYTVYDADSIIVLDDPAIDGAAAAFPLLDQIFEFLTAELVDAPEDYLFLVKSQQQYYDGIVPEEGKPGGWRPVVLMEKDVRRARKKLLENHDKGPGTNPLL